MTKTTVYKLSTRSWAERFDNEHNYERDYENWLSMWETFVNMLTGEHLA